MPQRVGRKNTFRSFKIYESESMQGVTVSCHSTYQLEYDGIGVGLPEIIEAHAVSLLC